MMCSRLTGGINGETLYSIDVGERVLDVGIVVDVMLGDGIAGGG
jgi:hypothetical protein